jgi:hypothetical protein
MKLIMTLLVRDEQDILEHHLNFHLAHGVDHFLIMDHHSRDRTPEILDHYVQNGVAEVFLQNDPGYLQSEWVTWMARRARQQYDANWVINSDADEFWWPMSGDLKSALAEVPAQYGSVSVQRHDFRPWDPESGEFLNQMIYRDTFSTSSLGQRLPEKVCHRGHAHVLVEQGNHGVSGPGMEHQWRSSKLEILHFPLRSYEQFERKIANGGRAYEQSRGLKPEIGATWRYLYEVYRQGDLERYYRKKCLSIDNLDQALSSGLVVKDPRLLERLS